MKYLLIHGFGTKVNYDLGVWKYPPTEDFLAWKDDIKSGNAKIFSWGILQSKSWKNIFNPIPYWELYKSEKSLANNKYMLLELDRVIKETNPKVIVCHSMGCYLLESYCGSFDLSKSVGKIVFSQGDVRCIPNIEQQLTKNTELKLENYFCGWDQALISSVIVNMTRPSGLFGLDIKQKFRNQIQNIFWSLGNLHKNCHVDGINNPKFKKQIEVI
jgi:hypothetical protein